MCRGILVDKRAGAGTSPTCSSDCIQRLAGDVIRLCVDVVVNRCGTVAQNNHGAGEGAINSTQDNEGLGTRID